MDKAYAVDRVPRHVAIIMDGNGRWASGRGQPRAAGHRAGAKTVREIVESTQDLGIKTLTLFAFSSENWQRPKAEVRVLLDLFLRTLRRELKDLKKNDVSLHFIGSRSRFAPALQKEMAEAEAETDGNQGLQLVVAVDYGGRWDVIQAAQQLAQRCARGELDPDAVDEALFSSHMTLHTLGAPDLFIRTGGERRLSNFLLWDLAYSELYFTDTLWPDFDANQLDEALAWYSGRDRRFGRVSTDSRKR